MRVSASINWLFELDTARRVFLERSGLARLTGSIRRAPCPMGLSMKLMGTCAPTM